MHVVTWPEVTPSRPTGILLIVGTLFKQQSYINMQLGVLHRNNKRKHMNKIRHEGI